MTKKLLQIKRDNNNTHANLDDAMKEDVHREVMEDYYFFNYLYHTLPQLFLNSKYRECEHRTYIVKEHYD